MSAEVLLFEGRLIKAEREDRRKYFEMISAHIVSLKGPDFKRCAGKQFLYAFMVSSRRTQAQCLIENLKAKLDIVPDSMLPHAKEESWYRDIVAEIAYLESFLKADQADNKGQEVEKAA